MYRCVHGQDGEVDLSLAQPLITAPMKITFTAPEKKRHNQKFGRSTQKTLLAWVIQPSNLSKKPHASGWHIFRQSLRDLPVFLSGRCGRGFDKNP